MPRMNRRGFLGGVAAVSSALLMPRTLSAATDSVPAADRLLLKGGHVLSLVDDEPVRRADMLIVDGRISRIDTDVTDAEARVVDMRDRVLMPGFVDTHRHMWQGALRNILPDGRLSDYMDKIGGQARSVFRPEDVLIGNRLSALAAIDAGCTTVLDWSHISNSPEHSDAAVAALRNSGLRSVYAYGFGAANPENRYPDDLERIRRVHLVDDDRMLTLALATGFNPEHWQLARDQGVRISVHVNGTGDLLPLADRLGPDVNCIHCCNLNEEEWRLLAATGAGVSISAPVEMIMGHGIPPIQQTLDYGVSQSLSIDVETTVPSNMFTQMRSILTLQRMQILDRERRGEENLPGLLRAADVLRYATVNGARHCGLEDHIGTLEPGKAADLIALDLRAINVFPVNDVVGAIVTGMDRGNVDTVIIDGKIRKWNGRLVVEDMEALMRQAEQSNRYLYGRTGWDRSWGGRSS